MYLEIISIRDMHSKLTVFDNNNETLQTTLIATLKDISSSCHLKQN